MSLIAYLHSALSVRLAELREQQDRGDSPVPTAIIIGGLALLAFAIVTAAGLAVDDWLDQIPAAP